MVLLDGGVFVVDVQAGGDAVGDDPGPEPAGGGPRAGAHEAAVEDETDLVGAAEVEVVPDDLFEEDPPGDGPVEHLGEGELGVQDGEVVAVAGGSVGRGERVRQTCQPFP